MYSSNSSRYNSITKINCYFNSNNNNNSNTSRTHLLLSLDRGHYCQAQLCLLHSSHKLLQQFWELHKTKVIFISNINSLSFSSNLRKWLLIQWYRLIKQLQTPHKVTKVTSTLLKRLANRCLNTSWPLQTLQIRCSWVMLIQKPN